ncbi:uncharacterized protein LOC101845704 [Aplysia californica]|uniref:Uncharacterized protein LOC101845704 n=1 Tax=Aplysia californica TaxID=6500 RepID=A0ABM1A332_APLCA|nr:uncharacterized protein LOC101845704 [Aplysia californica]
MYPVTWSIFVRRTWISLGILLSVVLTAVHGACPGDVSTSAHSCFTSYSFHFENMRSSPEKLCCGVDVETLRAFCHSYVKAISCLSTLRRACPPDTHHLIDSVLVNLDGAQEGLHDLCADDSIIESYAMYQTCFRSTGYSSERCFQVHMNESNQHIKFLSNVNTKRKDKFCSGMRNVVECVQNTVRGRCGEGAAKLAAILVKPMVRQSTDCDYSVINAKQTTSRPSHGNPAYISDEHGGRQTEVQDGGNTGSDARAPFAYVILAASLVAMVLGSLQPAS